MMIKATCPNGHLVPEPNRLKELLEENARNWAFYGETPKSIVCSTCQSPMKIERIEEEELRT